MLLYQKLLILKLTVWLSLLVFQMFKQTYIHMGFRKKKEKNFDFMGRKTSKVENKKV